MARIIHDRIASWPSPVPYASSESVLLLLFHRTISESSLCYCMRETAARVYDSRDSSHLRIRTRATFPYKVITDRKHGCTAVGLAVCSMLGGLRQDDSRRLPAGGVTNPIS